MNAQSTGNSSLQPVTPATCRQNYHYWQKILQQQEIEIQQLRSLLLEVMTLYNCYSLRHDAVDYYRDLNQLQSNIDRLTRDFICEGADCSLSAEKPACDSARFGLSASIERHATRLNSDYSRIKDGCLQFLSGLMSLNLL